MEFGRYPAKDEATCQAREVRMTLETAKARTSAVDWKKVHTTTEEDVRQHMVEDGENPDA